jgi:hypothetical protein
MALSLIVFSCKQHNYTMRHNTSTMKATIPQLSKKSRNNTSEKFVIVTYIRFDWLGLETQRSGHHDHLTLNLRALPFGDSWRHRFTLLTSKIFVTIENYRLLCHCPSQDSETNSYYRQFESIRCLLKVLNCCDRRTYLQSRRKKT